MPYDKAIWINFNLTVNSDHLFQFIYPCVIIKILFNTIQTEYLQMALIYILKNTCSRLPKNDNKRHMFHLIHIQPNLVLFICQFLRPIMHDDF